MRLVLVSLSLIFAVGIATPQASEPEAVFGHNLMTSQEVADYKSKLAQCSSDHERTQVMTEHKDKMVQRARWKGQVIRSETMTLAGND